MINKNLNGKDNFQAKFILVHSLRQRENFILIRLQVNFYFFLLINVFSLNRLINTCFLILAAQLLHAIAYLDRKEIQTIN